MASLRTWRRLSPSDRRLLARASWELVRHRVRLLVMPSGKVMVSARTHEGDGVSDVQRAVRVGWAVRAAARRIPGTSCLTEALAALALLEEAQLPRQLTVGVTKDAKGRFEAHAWVESGGYAVVGGAERERFSALPRPL